MNALTTGSGEIGDLTRQLSDVTRLLRKKRLNRASLVKVVGEGESHKIVEESMLAAKSALARIFADAGLPIIYKVHSIPGRPERRMFIAQVRNAGIPARMKDFTDPERFCALLGCLRDVGANRLLSQILDAYLARARYDTHNSGHMGLRLAAYMEIKALRNYAGLLNQRQAAQLLSGEPALNLHSMRRESNEINRKNRVYADNTFKLISLERIEEGLERQGQAFEAVVARVSGSGVYLDIPGLERSGLLQGFASSREPETTGQLFKTGDKLRVIQCGFDPKRDRFVFKLEVV
jgi:ribonuclease R